MLKHPFDCLKSINSLSIFCSDRIRILISFFIFRYESVWEDKRRFLERMSSLAWPVQARFKGVYDAWISHREGRRDAAAVDRSLTKFSPQSLELKQVSENVLTTCFT